MSPKTHWGLVVAFSSLITAAVASGCAQASDGQGDDGLPDGATDTTPPPNPTTCPPCLSDTDCQNGAICSQFGSDSYCAAPCPSGNECDSSHTCQQVTTASGDEESVCVPNNNACGVTPQPPSNDAGPPPNTCPGLASPQTPASCSSCSKMSNTCQPNGCYGGWWCNTMTTKCQAPPTNCGGSDGGTTMTTLDGGVTSSIGSDGGTESVLYFAVVGDTRPGAPKTTRRLPDDDHQTRSSRTSTRSARMPPFLVSTGDYQYANPDRLTQGSAQISLYMTARNNYSGVDLPGDGKPRVHGLHGLELRLGQHRRHHEQLHRVHDRHARAHRRRRSPYYVDQHRIADEHAGRRSSCSSRRTPGTARSRAGSTRRSA